MYKSKYIDITLVSTYNMHVFIFYYNSTIQHFLRHADMLLSFTI